MLPLKSKTGKVPKIDTVFFKVYYDINYTQTIRV